MILPLVLTIALFQPALGVPAVDPAVHDLTVLVVGDSWADNLARGMAEAAAPHPKRAIRVINAGISGCGIMQPVRVVRRGVPEPPKAVCSTWPERWRSLVERHRPTAVLLEDVWDAGFAQVLPGGPDPSRIVDPVFQARYAGQLDRAIAVLGGGGARVFLTTGFDGFGPAYRVYSTAQNAANRAAVRRNPAARLLDLHDQLCTPTGECPATISGVPVYDDSGHPSPVASRRLGSWLINSIHRLRGPGNR